MHPALPRVADSSQNPRKDLHALWAGDIDIDNRMLAGEVPQEVLHLQTIQAHLGFTVHLFDLLLFYYL